MCRAWISVGRHPGNLDDMESELGFHRIGHDARAEPECLAVELRHHLAPAEPAKVTALVTRPGILGKTARRLLEVGPVPQFLHDGVGPGQRHRPGAVSRLGRDYDLPDGDQGRPLARLGRHGSEHLGERRPHLRFRGLDRLQLALALEPFHVTLAQEVPPLLLAEPAPVVFDRIEPAAADFPLEVQLGGHPPPQGLELLVDRLGDLLVGHVHGGVAQGGLHQQLVVDQLVPRLVDRHLALGGAGNIRDVHPVLAQRDHHLGPEHHRVPHHGDDPVHLFVLGRLGARHRGQAEQEGEGKEPFRHGQLSPRCRGAGAPRPVHRCRPSPEARRGSCHAWCRNHPGPWSPGPVPRRGSGRPG